MRYILNDSGYIQAVSFNNLLECQNKTCTEYTGSVPTGYENLAIWSETANINAYKIVDGNLTYDSEEDARLQSLWASQESGSVNDAEILNTKSTSTTDTYSCSYINGTTDVLKTYPVGSVYMSENDTSPASLFGGTWVKRRTFYGGELIAYGHCCPTTTGTQQVSNTAVAFSDDSVGQDRTYNDVNYVDGILTGQRQAIWIQTKGIVGMVEATMTISGLGAPGLKGFWFRENNNALPSGVVELISSNARKPLLTGPIDTNYGGTSCNYIFKVDTTSDVGFYVNPKYTPYGGAFTPGSGGVACELIVKVYAKHGVTHEWIRTA